MGTATSGNAAAEAETQEAVTAATLRMAAGEDGITDVAAWETFTGYWRDSHGRQCSKGGFTTEALAVKHAKHAEALANPPETGLVYPETKRGKPTIAGYGLLAIAGAKLEPTSRETYTYLFKHVLAEFGSRALDEITPAETRAFARKLDAMVAAEKMSSSTASHVFGILKLIYITAVQDFPELKDPTAGISVQRKGSVEKVIATREQAKAVEREISAHYRLLTETRDVPVSKSLALRLIAAAGPDGRVFTSTRGGYIRRSNFHRVWKRACKKAGVPGLTPHSARHSVASWLANSPAVPLAEVSRMLGHSSLQQTSAYVHPIDDGDDSILNALGKAA